MSDAGVEVTMYLDHVEVVVEEATAEVLKQLAYRIVERTQGNIRSNDQIDTGYMVNSIYPIWKDGSSFLEAASAAESMPDVSKKGYGSRAGRTVINETLEAGASAAVVVGANYAIYQEVQKPFLYPAAELTTGSGEFEAEAQQIYKAMLPNEGPKA